jgi:hypothetical protein
MPLDAAALEELIQVIQRKTGGRKFVCSICGYSNWQVQADMVPLHIEEDLNSVSVGGPSLPVVPIVCVNCGNTHLLNIFVLGVGHLFGLSLEGAKR